MSEYIITDLTRFSNPRIVCIGVIELESGQCYRPTPHVSSKWVDECNLQPGDVLEGQLTLDDEAKKPHYEDADWTELEYVWTATSDLFRKVLRKSLSDSVTEGFDADVWYNRFLPADSDAKCSLITISVNPSKLKLSTDEKNAQRIRASFVDGSGRSYKTLPITDRGFPSYGYDSEAKRTLPTLNRLVRSQDEVFLRLGVTRKWQSKYWIQVNGIYMFPELEKMDD